MTFRILATQLPDGSERIELFEDLAGGLFRRSSSRVVPRSEWVRHMPHRSLSALTVATALAGQSGIEEDDQGVNLPFHAVALLDENDAHSLGLPPATPLTLQLRSSGSVSEGTIQVQLKWVRRGGVPVRAKRIRAKLMW
jgi:hypothetical protein